MGTDIHFYVQKRHPETREWVTIDGPEEIMSDFDREWEESHRHKDWYRRGWGLGRNYDLFAILADVRNGVGFAGIDTGDGFKTMTSERRGLPVDFVVDEWIREHDDPEHCHSHNWVSLREVLAFPWKDLETRHRGFVDEATFKKWLEDGKKGGPDSWCGGVSGRDIVHLSIAPMIMLVQDDVGREEGKQYYCQLEWGETYHDSCRHFCETVVPELEKLADGDPSSVRLVFWFDS